MPGHGERIIQTYEDWFVRINKRVQRLERRLAALPSTGLPEPTLLTNSAGFSGAVYAMRTTSGVVQIWSASVSGSYPAGSGTIVVAGANLPQEFTPRPGSANRVGSAYLGSGYTGVAVVSTAGNVTVYHQSGATRTSAQITITFIR